MKKLKFIVSGLALGLIFSAGISYAFTSPYPTSYTNWTAGDTITSAWLNAVEEMIGTGATTTPLTTLISQLQVNSFPSSTFAQVANNLSDLLSTSTARVNLGLNNLSNALQLIRSNNLSDLSSTSSARLNIGLGNLSNALQLVAANNLSDLTNTSTARTNLGLGSLATQNTPPTGFLISTSSVVSSTVLQAGTNITINQGSTSTIINATITSSTAAGSSGQVQSNQNGIFYADSGLTYTSSTQTLDASNTQIANNLNGTPVNNAMFYSMNGTNFTGSTNVTSILLSTSSLPAIGKNDTLLITDNVMTQSNDAGGWLNRIYVNGTLACSLSASSSAWESTSLTAQITALNSTSSQLVICNLYSFPGALTSYVTTSTMATSSFALGSPWSVSSTILSGGTNVISPVYSLQVVKENGPFSPN